MQARFILLACLFGLAAAKKFSLEEESGKFHTGKHHNCHTKHSICGADYFKIPKDTKTSDVTIHASSEDGSNICVGHFLHRKRPEAVSFSCGAGSAELMLEAGTKKGFVMVFCDDSLGELAACGGARLFQYTASYSIPVESATPQPTPLFCEDDLEDCSSADCSNSEDASACKRHCSLHGATFDDCLWGLCLEKASHGSGLIGSYTPQCEADGSFSAIQCHGSTGYCWCVDQTTGDQITDPVGPAEELPVCTQASESSSESSDSDEDSHDEAHHDGEGHGHHGGRRGHGVHAVSAHSSSALGVSPVGVVGIAAACGVVISALFALRRRSAPSLASQDEVAIAL